MKVTKNMILGICLILGGFFEMIYFTMLSPVGFEISEALLPLFIVSVSVSSCCLIGLGTLLLAWRWN